MVRSRPAAGGRLLMGFFSNLAASFFGDSGVDASPVPMGEEWMLSEILPWRDFDAKDGRNVYRLADIMGREGVGVMLEVAPVCGGDEAAGRIHSLIKDSFPEGGVVQIINWSSPSITGELNRWWAPRLERGGVAGRMARERVKFIEEGRYSSVIRPIVLPHLRRLFITARIEGALTPRGFEALDKFRKAVKGAFRDMGGASEVAPDKFCGLVDELLHRRMAGGGRAAKHNRREPLNTQFAGSAVTVFPDGVRLSGDPEIAVACGAVQRLPDQFAFGQGAALNGVPDNPEMRPLGPVLTTMSIAARTAESAKATAMGKVTSLSHKIDRGMAKMSPGATRQKNEWERVGESIARGEKLLDVSLIVCAYVAQEEAAPTDAIDEMRKIWRAQNVELGDETGVHLPLLMNALPFGASARAMRDLKSMMRTRVTLSDVAGHLAPVHGEWNGHRDPDGVLLFGRTGQLMTWNPFRSETNYNVAVSGRSGSGKSVFMQEMAGSLVSSGGRAIVVDDGRSFENTALALDGDFVTFDEAASVCINPFSLISAGAMDSGGAEEATEEHSAEDYRSIALGAATSIAVTIATDGSGAMTPFERQLIRDAVDKAWGEKGVDASFTDVKRNLEERGVADPRAQDLAAMFSRFASGGEYARWFEGRSDLRINSAFTVFELGDIKSNRLMKTIVLQIIMFLGEQLMFNTDRSIRVGLFIDEAWDLLDGDEMGRFIGGIARRARKHSGMLVTGTQSINDFYANPAAKATIDNSDWTVVLSQKGEAIENLRRDNRLSVSEYVRQQLSSLKKHDGAFSEMGIRNSDGGWVFARLVLDPYSIGVYSSKGATVERLKRLRASGVPLEDAIARLVEEGAT